MDHQCDILILTASFGMGHKSASHAIKDQINSCCQGVSIEIKDIFEIIKPELYKGIYKGYEFLIRMNSRLYNYFYYKKNSPENLQMEEIIYKLYLPKLAGYLVNLRPKIIISTFPMCSGFVSSFKQKYRNSTPLITCITDVIDNSEWIYPETDMYLVAADYVKDSLIKRGINEDIINVTGIPVKKEFLYNERNKDSLGGLGISENDFVIMIMGGGMGLLPKKRDFYHWLNGLKGVKTLVLTGRNHELYKRLSKYDDLSNIKVLGYTEKVFSLMAGSDLLITKAGGVTLFEAIASRLPIIAYKPQLGQEIENSRFILDTGIGSVAEDLNDLKKDINNILKSEKQRNHLNYSISNINSKIRKNGLANIILSNYGILINDSNYLFTGIQ